jgi:topoisomerase IA-like protein
VPNSTDPASITLEGAVALLKARAEAGPSKRRGGGRVGGGRKKK